MQFKFLYSSCKYEYSPVNSAVTCFGYGNLVDVEGFFRISVTSGNYLVVYFANSCEHVPVVKNFQYVNIILEWVDCCLSYRI